MDLLVTQKQSLSSKGAGLGRTANSPVYEASLNSQFIGMMSVCHYMILLLVTKQHLRTQDKMKGTGRSKSPRTQTSKGTLIKYK